ncbi:cupin domain-containing protein [Niabella sp. W65]|nr:cupin domain-containing protein [Niabella sp. W65]MCH7364532.1 cupin domain-containing protein [Niabella sp. W65]ULT40391.1 cupin domain-containing protein [Niabella sp. I65]
MAALEFTLPKGAEPPPHVHVNEDESFFVLYGRISVIVGDTVTILEKGVRCLRPVIFHTPSQYLRSRPH